MTDPEMLEILQAEAAAWTLRNFPDQPAYHPLLGMVEELGELLEAVEAANFGAVHDAFADILIFAANLCTHCDLSVATIWENRLDALPPTHAVAPVSLAPSPAIPALTIAMGKVAHHRLKYEQGIRGNAQDHLNGLANALAHLFVAVDALLPNVVPVAFKVWREEVQPRNWRADC